MPYAPALIAAGLDLGRLFIVRCRTLADQLWAYEQALRAPECGAAFAWLGSHDERPMRRLAVAAREGRTWGVLWRRPGQQAIATPASLRLLLAPREGQLAVRVLKRRGGDLAQPVIIDVGRRDVAALAGFLRSAPRARAARWRSPAMQPTARGRRTCRNSRKDARTPSPCRN
jgi:hypothetical protein